MKNRRWWWNIDISNDTKYVLFWLSIKIVYLSLWQVIYSGIDNGKISSKTKILSKKYLQSINYSLNLKRKV